MRPVAGLAARALQQVAAGSRGSGSGAVEAELGLWPGLGRAVRMQSIDWQQPVQMSAPVVGLVANKLTDLQPGCSQPAIVAQCDARLPLAVDLNSRSSQLAARGPKLAARWPTADAQFSIGIPNKETRQITWPASSNQRLQVRGARQVTGAGALDRAAASTRRRERQAAQTRHLSEQSFPRRA